MGREAGRAVGRVAYDTMWSKWCGAGGDEGCEEVVGVARASAWRRTRCAVEGEGKGRQAVGLIFSISLVQRELRCSILVRWSSRGPSESFSQAELIVSGLIVCGSLLSYSSRSSKEWKDGQSS